VSLEHPYKIQWVSYLGSFTAQHSGSGPQPNCSVEQRAPPIFSRAAIPLGIGPHSSFIIFVLRLTISSGKWSINCFQTVGVVGESNVT